MFKKAILVSTVLFAASLNTYAFDGSQYSKSGEELCRYISNVYGGFNPYSMQCAMGAGAGDFTAHESGFCHKLIIEKRMDAGTCLSIISAEIPDSKLGTCELMGSEQSIIDCLQQ